jgi:hypothetical protein
MVSERSETNHMRGKPIGFFIHEDNLIDVPIYHPPEISRDAVAKLMTIGAMTFMFFGIAQLLSDTFPDELDALFSTSSKAK